MSAPQAPGAIAEEIVVAVLNIVGRTSPFVSGTQMLVNRITDAIAAERARSVKAEEALSESVVMHREIQGGWKDRWEECDRGHDEDGIYEHATFLAPAHDRREGEE